MYGNGITPALTHTLACSDACSRHVMSVTRETAVGAEHVRTLRPVWVLRSKTIGSVGQEPGQTETMSNGVGKKVLLGSTF